MIKCYFDGACEPNQTNGKMAYGGVIYQHEEKIHEFSYPYKPKDNIASNNIAEYCGLIATLHYLINREFTNHEIYIFGDSQLVINQMAGRWNMNEGKYLKYAIKAKYILQDHFIKPPVFEWIPKERNTEADKLSRIFL
jgi:ribonuclease HI